ncbi:MAG TPA: protease pro-enzyme activation domain-containing protein, partial [Acidobacteriaceae bacterium]|nr:protease pro-enzyme activation domain-containing protein [Acidobacteriaceae bacterium]
MSATVAQAQSVKTHHVRDAVKHEQANGHLPQGQLLNLNLVLPLRNQAGLDALLAQVNDPASPMYRHYLTPAQFTEQFGPSQSDYNAVVQWANTHGLRVTGGTRGASDVEVQATVGAVESALHVHMNTYKHPNENRNFYSADAEPTTDLPFSLWHVSGLDNFSIPKPLMVNKDEFAAAHGISPDQVVSHATTGSGPSASFLGTDMRAAYYGSGSLTGAGQTIGLLEYYGTDLVDLQNYYKNVGQTYPANGVIQLLSTDGTSTSCVYSSAGGFCDDGEQNLDMTQALGMAPGL